MEYRGFTKRSVISLAAALTLLAAGCSSPGATPPTGAPTEPMAAPAVVGSQEALPPLDPATTTLETLWAHPFYGPMVRKHSSPSSKIVFVDPAIVDQAWLDAQKYPKGTIVLPSVKGAPTYQVQGHPGGETVRPNCDYNHEMIGSSYPGADVVFAGVIYGSGSWWYRYRPEATYFYWAYAPNYPRTQDEWWLLTTCWNGPRPTPAPSATPSGDGSGGAGDPSSSPSPTPTPTPTPLDLSLSASEFSPNLPEPDGTKDTISVSVESADDWTLKIEGLGTVKQGDANETFDWDGSLSSGLALADGQYTLSLVSNGQETTETVVIDRQSPSISNVSVQSGGISTDGLSFKVKGSASLQDLGLAGVAPSEVTVSINGPNSFNSTYEPSDGATVNFETNVAIGKASAYRIAQAASNTLDILIVASDKVGNTRYGRFIYEYDPPASGAAKNLDKHANLKGHVGLEVGLKLIGQAFSNEGEPTPPQPGPAPLPGLYGIYEPNPKHRTEDYGRVSREPSNGQLVLNNSLPVSPETTTRRIGVDPDKNEIVVFDEHAPGKFHGHVRLWKDLTQTMQAVLRRAGLVTAKGKIIKK